MSDLDKEILKLHRQRQQAKRIVTKLCKIYLKEMKPLPNHLTPANG